MNRRYGCVMSLLALTLLFVGCTPPPPPDTRAQDEMAIREADKAWNAAAQAKDPEKFTAAYADDAVLMLPNSPEMSGKTAIHDAITTFMKDPAFALSFETKSVEVAKSGDLAFELGTYSVTSTDEKTKKPVTAKGHGVTIWKKQADGSWKVRIDAPVEEPVTPPAPLAAAKAPAKAPAKAAAKASAKAPAKK